MREWILNLIARVAPFREREPERRPRRRDPDGPIATCTRVRVGTVMVCGGGGDHRVEIDRIHPNGRGPDYRLSLQYDRGGGEWETLLVVSPAVVGEFKALLDESVRFIGTLERADEAARN